MYFTNDKRKPIGTIKQNTAKGEKEIHSVSYSWLSLQDS